VKLMDEILNDLVRQQNEILSDLVRELHELRMQAQRHYENPVYIATGAVVKQGPGGIVLAGPKAPS
jgi:hypothetical protein